MDTPKKTFSFENGSGILPPRIVSSRSRGYVAPSRRRPPPDGDEEERVTNQRKQRYWNSYEEMYIVELWRLYKDEIIEFNKPLPVHRKIMVAMRSKEMMVTGQDCRRKINTLNNRYKMEVQRLKIGGGKSDWRLFPLIHCIMEPKVKEFDAWHETKVVKKVLEEMPKPPELMVAPPWPTVVATPSVPTTVRKGQQQLIQRDVPVPVYSNVKSYLPSLPPPVINKIPTYTSENISKTPSVALNKKLSMHSNMASHTTAKSNLPFRDITFEKYQQVKQSNEILSLQRDATLQRLRLEEEECKIFEYFLNDLRDQAQALLETVENLKESNFVMDMITNISFDVNANNGDVEMKLSDE